MATDIGNGAARRKEQTMDSSERLSMYDQIGTAIFLTRDAAEAALKGATK
jgi:hypothetical protein